ncbi:hypothetical protein [Streptomyces viridochromogenes]|uniref:hypothetical protein n=1 Tax=Streptomyces viridochromogenes TaxID=1938 RepID=UPI000B2D7ED1|nr:hypothetical protein [Streptomyces viridochromogenes]
MEKLNKALAWARENKRVALAGAAVVAGVVAHYVPGLPKEAIVNAVAVLLGV